MTAMRGAMLIGIDWGGTKIEGVAMERDGRELLRLREATPRHDCQGFLRMIREGFSFFHLLIDCSACPKVMYPIT
jgi:predicted NBD/HSP70 family sugar kinase